MEFAKADRSLIRAGFFLFMLALFTGFAIPNFLNQRMAVAAHLAAVLNALLLIALGLVWGLLALSPAQAKWTRIAFLGAAFVNWGSSCLAAAWGTTRLTPVAGAGFGAAPWQEIVVQVLQVSIALGTLAGTALVLYGLRVTRAGGPGEGA